MVCMANKLLLKCITDLKERGCDTTRLELLAIEIDKAETIGDRDYLLEKFQNVKREMLYHIERG